MLTEIYVWTDLTDISWYCQRKD